MLQYRHEVLTILNFQAGQTGADILQQISDFVGLPIPELEAIRRYPNSDIEAFRPHIVFRENVTVSIHPFDFSGACPELIDIARRSASK